MRFISKISGYKIPGVHQEIEPLANGTTRVLVPGFMCEFQHGGLNDSERDLARRSFVWKGLPTARDGTPLDPVRDLHRVGVFDTEWAPAELQERVEKALLTNPACGIDYIPVELPKVEAPWPGYDKLTVQGRRTIDHVVEKIGEMVEAGGYDPAAVAEYERQNLARGEVLAALEALRPQQAEPDDELVTA